MAKHKSDKSGTEFNAGGIFKGLGDLVEKLTELAEAGKELKNVGEIHGEGQQLKGIYGFSVKVGLGDQQPRIEPFGNIRRDTTTGRTVVSERREPVADVFEEKDHVLVVVELPGISLEDIRVEAEGDLLTITAEKGEKKYRKQVQLPGPFDRSKMQLACNNGVLEVKCNR